MMKSDELAKKIGDFREALGSLAEGGPTASGASGYRELRQDLMADDRVSPLLPDFVIECRTPRSFWDYIQRAFAGAGAYTARSRYIEAQLLPIERQFRPARERAPGVRPAEVRLEYSPVRPVAPTGLTFVAETRLAELRAIRSDAHDLGKLIRLCEELNVAYSEGCYLATIMLTRALQDHVPPIFGMHTFAELANNRGARSFKETMQRLESTARKIADAHLHQTMRRRETLPVAQQVNFSAEVDVLLAEIILVLA
jgi:hypothetical protein